jgi:GH43 family beta-xylosidase
MAKLNKPEDLNNAEFKVVYEAPEGTMFSHELWAPELHIINGKCYIYVACDDGDNNNHRMYVLENNSDDPQKPYKMHGKIVEESDKWAIDGTLMNYKGEYYFVWSGWQKDENVCQNLYIAKMKNPYELDGKRVLISTPEFDWELKGATDKFPFINEGAYAFSYNGKHYLTYSAAGSWCEDYCIALLELVGDDPLNPKSWKKHPEFILSENDTVKGAGHCCILQDDDELKVIFHAWEKDEQNIKWDNVYVWCGVMKSTQNGFEIV